MNVFDLVNWGLDEINRNPLASKAEVVVVAPNGEEFLVSGARIVSLGVPEISLADDWGRGHGPSEAKPSGVTADIPVPTNRA